MKRSSFLSSAIISLGFMAMCASCSQGNKYTLDSDITAFDTLGIKVISANIAKNNIVLDDKAEIKDGHITISGTADDTAMAFLNIQYTFASDTAAMVQYFIFEPGDITISFDNDFYATGTPLNDALTAFRRQKNEYHMKEDIKSVKRVTEEFISNHKDDATMQYLFSEDSNLDCLGPKVLDSLYSTISETNKQLTSLWYEKYLKPQLGSAEGSMFIDFEVEYDGKVQRLSDYVGKGKYVLVDFWASWCGPCRAEIPNLIAAYNTYKGDRFDVVGVASWDKPDATLKAIEEEKVPYPQIINAQEAACKAYGITGIPEIILFGPDGTILKRGLRGANIDREVKAALAN